MGATKNNTGGAFENQGDWENSNMRGHTKFLGGLTKQRGQGFQGPVTEGCIHEEFSPSCTKVFGTQTFYEGGGG